MSDHSIFSSTIPNGQDHSIEVGDSETGIDLSGYFSREELEGDTRNYDVRLRADVNAYAADDGADQADASLARYRMSRGGLFYYSDSKKNVEDDDETAKPIWLSPPFEVVARTRDPDGNWGKLLWWNDHDGVEVKWVMPARLLGGHRDELWQALYERGLEISSANAARNHLLAYLTRVNPEGRANVVSRLGWYTEGGANLFVLPDAVYGDTGGLEIIYSGNAASTPYGVKGSLEEWRERIGRPCAGNSRLAFAVSVAFASPLLHVVGEESGGFHFRGGSRAGKTTAERLAGSVWGGGDSVNGFLISYRATSNGLEGTCEDHCDALLCLDEMGQVDAREAGEIVYMIANQGGKQRAARDGSARRAKQWRLMFLSTGEISLADKLTEVGRRPRAGQEVRLVDIPADAGAGYGIFEDLHRARSAGEFADRLKRATLECYGAPIRVYLDHAARAHADDPAAIAAAFRDLRDDFVASYLPEGPRVRSGRCAGDLVSSRRLANLRLSLG